MVITALFGEGDPGSIGLAGAVPMLSPQRRAILGYDDSDIRPRERHLLGPALSHADGTSWPGGFGGGAQPHDLAWEVREAVWAGLQVSGIPRPRPCGAAGVGRVNKEPSPVAGVALPCV